MDEKQKQEILYVLESRLTKYITAAKQWYSTTGAKIKGTYTDRINGDIPLYFRSNVRKWQSIVPNISPFCFLFTQDLSISNMLDSHMHIEDVLIMLSNEGLVIQDMRIIVKDNTHLLGTSKQVIILVPAEMYVDKPDQKLTVELSLREVLEIIGNETVPQRTRTMLSRQLQGKKEHDAQ